MYDFNGILVDDSWFTVVKCPDRLAWLKERRKYIGASDAAAVLGLSPWMSNSDLYDEKTSTKEPDPSPKTNGDIMRGVLSEKHILELFCIEHSLDGVSGEGYVLVSKDYPWMSCTLDGIVQDPEAGDAFALEIKSVRYTSHWKDTNKLPDHYYIQVLHQLAVTKWLKVVLRARIIYSENVVTERNYTVYYKDVKGEIESLAMLEKQFMDEVKSRSRPATILPSL